MVTQSPPEAVVKVIIESAIAACNGVINLRDEFSKSVNEQTQRLTGSIVNLQAADKEIADALTNVEIRLRAMEQKSNISADRDNKGVMEFKAVQGIKEIPEDKSMFRQWNKKFVIAMKQVREGYSDLIVNIGNLIDGGENQRKLRTSW